MNTLLLLQEPMVDAAVNVLGSLGRSSRNGVEPSQDGQVSLLAVLEVNLQEGNTKRGGIFQPSELRAVGGILTEPRS